MRNNCGYELLIASLVIRSSILSICISYERINKSRSSLTIYETNGAMSFFVFFRLLSGR